MIRNSAQKLSKRTLSRAAVPDTFRSAFRAMSSSLPEAKPPLSSQPADSYQLLPTPEKAGSSEDALFEQQVRDLTSWWESPRFEGIKRPYSAEDVVSKRGSLQQTYSSSLMARKLFKLFKERAAAGEPVHTSMSFMANQAGCL